MEPSDLSSAEQRDLVRRGYNAVSHRYRSDAGTANLATAEATETYASWLAELAEHLPPKARVLDIGCGAGVPADRWLVDAGYDVTGIDISDVQIERARVLVPEANFLRTDITNLDAPEASFDAVLSLYALIHVPLADQRRLFPRIRGWLKPGGVLMAMVGHQRWIGVEEYLGAPMFWDHADAITYLEWLDADGFEVLWDRFIPEGPSGHQLVLARVWS